MLYVSEVRYGSVSMTLTVVSVSAVCAAATAARPNTRAKTRTDRRAAVPDIPDLRVTVEIDEVPGRRRHVVQSPDNGAASRFPHFAAAIPKSQARDFLCRF